VQNSPGSTLSPFFEHYCLEGYDDIAYEIVTGQTAKQAQTLSRREINGLQRTSWQRRYSEKKPCCPFEVPRTAAETDMLFPLDRQRCIFQSPRPVRLPGGARARYLTFQWPPDKTHGSRSTGRIWSPWSVINR